MNNTQGASSAQVQTHQSVLVPGDALILVGVGVRVALDGAGLAAEQAVERGADLVALARLEGVALRAAGLEEVGTLLGVTYGSFVSGTWSRDRSRGCVLWWGLSLVMLEWLALLQNAALAVTRPSVSVAPPSYVFRN